MILKALIIAAVIGFIYLKFFHKPSAQQMPSKKKKKESPKKTEETVECCVCSTYVSVDEAILSGSKYFCSQECLEKSC